MKSLQKALCTLALAAATLGVAAAPAWAEEYQYTVRVFGGNQGTVATASKTYAYDPANPTEVDVVAEFGEPTLKNPEKYYFKYYRIAGQDDNTANRKAVVTVDHDIDLVAAYGALGEMKTVTIRFTVQGTGQVLGTREVVGKVNDQIVQGYEYFEGYRPLYRNITGVVKSDDAGNVWVLEYVPVEAPEGEEIVRYNDVVMETEAPAAGGAEAGAAGGAAAAEGGAAGGAAVEGGAEGGAAAEPAAPPTQEILDVDNPLAAPGGEGSGSEGSGTEGQGESIPDDGTPTTGLAAITSNPGAIAGIIAGLLAAAGLLFWLLRKKGQKE